jgi:hypothetical protein
MSATAVCWERLLLACMVAASVCCHYFGAHFCKPDLKAVSGVGRCQQSVLLSVLSRAARLSVAQGPELLLQPGTARSLTAYVWCCTFANAKHPQNTAFLSSPPTLFWQPMCGARLQMQSPQNTASLFAFPSNIVLPRFASWRIAYSSIPSTHTLPSH